MPNPLHLVISRTDAIGDVCLTLPAIGWLKTLFPEWRITLLVKAYAAPVARACRWVDHVAVLPESMNADELSEWLRDMQADHIMHVFPNRRIATAARQAGIPRRSGVWGRVYHWFNCNNRVWLSRARSTHHEAYLNLLLLSKLLHLPLPSDAEWRQHVVDWSGLRPGLRPSTSKDIVLHPFSRGNGREWPIEHFAELALLMVNDGWQPVIGGTAADAQAFASQQHLFPESCLNVMGTDSLEAYMQRIANAAGLVASGTGPLHIASLLGQNCAGLFPPKASVSQTRWGAIGPASTNLQLAGPCDTVCSNHDCACMRAISPDQVWRALQQQLATTLATDAAL
jgi:ADP-heptose:LPS heptosyltransferase